MRDVQPTDADLIDFTRLRFNHAGAQDKAIRERFDLGAIAFWQRVLQIVQSPARVAALPAELQVQCVRLSRRMAA